MRTPRKQPDKPPPIPPGLAAEFAARPFGIAGEMLTPGPPEPPRPLPQPFVIPPWDGPSDVEPAEPEPELEAEASPKAEPEPAESTEPDEAEPLR